MKYIPADKLIELVKEWRSKQIGFAWDAVNEVLKIITSLQQEQPENYDAWAREYVPQLLELAKKEIEKDLPRWRKEQGEMELAAYGFIGGGVASQENPRVYLNGYSIDLFSLKKLPKEDEI